jgi:hypothetical protein
VLATSPAQKKIPGFDLFVVLLFQDASYVTEVHHITGEGEDGGVVYCEMQARENTAVELIYREGLRGLYPGRCGYKSNTGGALKNLRESTSVEKVGIFSALRMYHCVDRTWKDDRMRRLGVELGVDTMFVL